MDAATTRTDFPRTIREIEHQIITMPDGCRLSARIWLPDDAEDKPVPAILEHLPYRKRDGTVVRDSLNHPWFAGHGYACLRVDMRGNGDSEGLMTDEYTAEELQDACTVIEWASQQAWCSGTVGMMGISWGGFNALQVASLKPPALKAIITACSTVDRFADDIHFKGGCLLGENIGWAATMLSYSSRPPDPLLVGEAWHSMWMDRLANMPFLASRWISAQERQEYWKHGSVCENYGAIEAAVLSIGGWHDGYRNTVSHLVEHLECPVKGIVGPWIHKYPHYAAPAPRIGFLQEALAWWDHWLKSIDNGAQSLPDYRVYLMDSIAPARWYDERPGRWISENNWPSTTIQMQRYRAVQDTDNQLSLRADTGAATALQDVQISTPAHCGSQTGEYFPFTFGPELPDEQSSDDAMSTVFETDVMDEPIDIVGAAQLSIQCSADKPLAFLVVRLCDIDELGNSALISMGVCNLTHARSAEAPETLVPGKLVDATVALDQIAYHLPAGHRLRLAFSSSYWPFIWPSPAQTTVSLVSANLDIPLRPLSQSTDECSFEPAETASPWPHEVIRPSSSERKQSIDKTSGMHKLHIHNDFGKNRDSNHRLVSGSKVSELWSIHPNNPLSATVAIDWEQELERDEWKTRTHATVSMYCDANWFYITGSLSAWENTELAFHRDYKEKVARLFV